MKKILLSVVAVISISVSVTVNSALQPIDGADVHFGQANLSQASDVSGVNVAVNTQQKAVDHVSRNLDAQMVNLNNNPAVNQASSQTMMNALPKVDASGQLHIQLQGSSITYGTINMGMGDFTKIPAFKEAPTINR